MMSICLYKCLLRQKFGHLLLMYELNTGPVHLSYEQHLHFSMRSTTVALSSECKQRPLKFEVAAGFTAITTSTFHSETSYLAFSVSPLVY